MKDIYITKSGTLSRKENSIIFTNINQKNNFPINNVNSIYLFDEVSLNSKLLEYLSQFEIPVYFYNHYEFFIGEFEPRKRSISGKLLIRQVKSYLDNDQRLILAKEIQRGAMHNMRKTLMQYDLNDEAEKMKEFINKIENTASVSELMLLEAKSKEFYYKQFNKIIKNPDFEFIMRVRRPPDNFINTLISFGNSLLYTTVLSEIFKTQLNPTISYLHEPFERRYSLNLDLADLFKPLIVDRVIFSLVNRNQIKPEHFNKKLNFCYLNDEGRKIFIKEYDSKLNMTIKYPKLNRKVSYRYMLRLECYKLIKFFLEEKKYNSFKIYW